MGEFAIFVVAVFVFVAVTIAKGVRIVPQGEEWIVERLGKYHTTARVAQDMNVRLAKVYTSKFVVGAQPVKLACLRRQQMLARKFRPRQRGEHMHFVRNPD